MKVRPSAWFIGLLLLAACPGEKGDAKTEESTADTSKTSAPAATSAAQATAPNPTPAGTTPPPAATTAAAGTAPADTGAPATAAGAIEPKVKGEVDNKPDGVTDGTAMTVPAAKAVIQAPKGYTAGPGLAKTADDHARIAVAPFGPEGPEKAIPVAAAAAGLTNCQWSTPPDTVTAGKDKLTASVADGLCTHGAGKAKAAMMAVEGLLVVGTWDDGGDAAGVFNAFRSVTKANNTDSLAACCAAIRQNAKSAPPAQAGLYIIAAGTCDSMRKNPGAAAQIRQALRGLNVPSSCR